MKKNVIAILLAACMLLALTACAAKAPAADTASDNPAADTAPAETPAATEAPTEAPVEATEAPAESAEITPVSSMRLFVVCAAPPESSFSTPL